jgi:hypothetical protein
MMFHDVMERRYPGYVSRILSDVMIYSIYAFSHMQMYSFQVFANLNEFVDTNYFLREVKKSLLSQQMVEEVITWKALTIFIKRPENLHKISYAAGTAWNHQDTNNEEKMESSSSKFMLLECRFGNTTTSYKIDLKTDNHDYYVVGNEFNREFFVFFVSYYFNVKDVTESDACHIRLIDHEVNSVEVIFPPYGSECIVLENTTYCIR